MEELKPVTSEEQKKRRLEQVEIAAVDFPRVGGGGVQINAKRDNSAGNWTIQCAFVQRDLVDNEGNPLPDGGLLDIEAKKGSHDVVHHNREIAIYGEPSAPDHLVKRIIDERIPGFVTRQRGLEGDYSLEVVMLDYTPGNWGNEAKDVQFNRKIVFVEIDSEGKVRCRNFGSSDAMLKLPMDVCTEKVLLATSDAKDVCAMLNSMSEE